MLFSTVSSSPQNRGRDWRETVSSAYFPLDVKCADEPKFNGDLRVWSLGPVTLSRLDCDGLLYRRHSRHLVSDQGADLLITVPVSGEISFSQDGRETRCSPGGFLLERSDAPYEFWHKEHSTMWVVKAPSAAVRARIGPPERLAALTFDATRGIGACFLDMIQSAVPRLGEMEQKALDTLGQHIVELACLAIHADDRVLDTHVSSVRAAHLYRAEQYVRSHLERSELAPQQIADACGISVRYLQQLFADSGRSVCDWVRDQRLQMCDEELRRTSSRLSISEIAYSWGFADQSQFSKHYRRRFGRTPSEARMQFRDGRPPPQ